MKNLLRFFVVAALVMFSVQAADDVVTAVHGTITKLDSGTKTMVVKTKDGTEQTVHFTDKTAVWGADKTAAGAKDTFKGLSEGSEVIVHYRKRRIEIGRRDGRKSGQGWQDRSGQERGRHRTDLRGGRERYRRCGKKNRQDDGILRR